MVWNHPHWVSGNICLDLRLFYHGRLSRNHLRHTSDGHSDNSLDDISVCLEAANSIQDFQF